ncbi:sigma-70 family RNA polymerase sigma factor [Paraliomyxa miuraensis]|uniref:sigma-70 family RNA polymerase sigma factor n=1 Tax=Paraliomyxa miuraensis TaxID=376150 RepID=UPI00225AAA56|nr:sigma-70 family RNA polymerase sigma factor [Paraliomyxa miuraensis]MCX4242075.1 sigma-70 family RNA polymerase sigma factor [Paraliomyxa miuraensis]
MASVDYHALFSSHREHLWGLCYRMTGSAADAEDLVQDTFARALEKPPADTESPWRPWLARVATRLAIDALRHRKSRSYVGPWLPSPVETSPSRSVAGAGEPASSEPDAEVRYGLRESASLAFLRALEALDPVPRAALVLRDALGYSGPETAEILGVSPENARVILHRARKALARYEQVRRPPSPEVDAAHQAALQRFMAVLVTGDVEQIAACLAQDARLTSDGGGQYYAALKPVLGRDKVARFFAGVLERGGAPVAVELRWINERPGVLVCSAPGGPRNAPRSCMTFDLDEAGLVSDVHLVVADDKLRALRFPEP